MKISLPTEKAPWGISPDEGSVYSSSLIKSVVFNITGRCEGGCITCPTVDKYDDEKIKKTVFDLTNESEKFKGMFRRIKDFGLDCVMLYGREPLLWDKEAETLLNEQNYFLKHLIKWLSQDLSVKCCLLTSGLGLNESLLRILFENNCILFMKNWGSEKSFNRLMKYKNAYKKNQDSWVLVKKLRKDYDKIQIMAEFLYTGINREDLLDFWKSCIIDDIWPYVESPTIRDACKDSYSSLKINLEDYVKDIYELSLLNISLISGIGLEEAKEAEFWYPPYGSVFPSSCTLWTKAKSFFMERNGNLSICSGVRVHIGNINDEDIEEKIRKSRLLSKVRTIYQNLQGWCANCEYSKKLQICYGCRGNAFTYKTASRGIFGEDPMCFGKVALNLGEEKLSKFMSSKHIKRLKQCFGYHQGLAKLFFPWIRF